MNSRTGFWRELRKHARPDWQPQTTTVIPDFKPSARSYLDGATRYVEAAGILCDTARSLDPIGLVASHGVELGLKAYLLHRGMTERELRDIGHDLAELWMRARVKGLEIEYGPPYWVRVLSVAHGRPHLLYRYPPERVASAIPDPQELKRALSEFLHRVSLAIAG